MADTVRVNLYLPQDAYDAIVRLQQLSGKDSLEETIVAALRLYGVEQDASGALRKDHTNAD